MTKIRVLCVGRPRDPVLAGVHDRYAERILAFGVDYASRWVPEIVPGRRFSDAHVRERESRALLDALDPRANAVALDSTGSSWTSEEFAARLSRWAGPGICFLVGGPLGHDESLRERAVSLWSLSPLTFPHEIVRVLVAEQVYRSLTILRGMPYHKGRDARGSGG